MNKHILLPSKPKVVSEEDEFSGTYEIDGFYPGYGYTIGNSLRRIILSSLRGAAITSVKIEGADHEFTTLDGVKEDVIMILLNLKRVRLAVSTDEPQTLELHASGAGEVTAGDIELPGQVEVKNPDQIIATLTDKSAKLNIQMTVETGLGFVSKEDNKTGKDDIGVLTLDAVFSPIRRVNYKVENMRVGERTDFNRLQIHLETDGTLTAREALEKSINVMIHQLKAIVGFKEAEEIPEIAPNEVVDEEISKETESDSDDDSGEEDGDFIKTRTESLDLSTRTKNALEDANIRTAGGLVQKTESDILDIEGIGNKGLNEIKDVLSEHGASLASE